MDKGELLFIAFLCLMAIASIVLLTFPFWVESGHGFH